MREEEEVGEESAKILTRSIKKARTQNDSLTSSINLRARQNVCLNETKYSPLVSK